MLNPIVGNKTFNSVRDVYQFPALSVIVATPVFNLLSLGSLLGLIGSLRGRLWRSWGRFWELLGRLVAASGASGSPFGCLWSLLSRPRVAPWRSLGRFGAFKSV